MAEHTIRQQSATQETAAEHILSGSYSNPVAVILVCLGGTDHLILFK